MVKNCANPQCAKPLHYLREGRVFVFEAKVSSEHGSMHQLEHYWLCGECSRTLRLEKTLNGIRVVPKRSFPQRETQPIHRQLAS